MNWKPNKWIASVIGLVFGPIGVLYTGFPVLAAFVMLAMIMAAVGVVVVPGMGSGTAISALKLFFGVGLAGLCFVLARRAKPRDNRPWYTRWYGLLGAILAVVLAIVLFRAFFYETFVTKSSSMSPAAEPGAILVVQKFGYAPVTALSLDFGKARKSQSAVYGDIVVFVPPNRSDQVWIKRVVGLPGDTITYRDRHLYLNGVDTRGSKHDGYLDHDKMDMLDRYEERIGNAVYEIILREEAAEFPPPEAFPFNDRCTYRADDITCTVPPDHYYLLGDNRDNSLDSRTLGFVRSAAVIGKVVHISR